MIIQSLCETDHMSELRIKNESERDICSCELTSAATNKEKKIIN